MARFLLRLQHNETGFEDAQSFEAMHAGEAVQTARDVARLFLKQAPDAADAVMSVHSDAGDPLLKANLSDLSRTAH